MRFSSLTQPKLRDKRGKKCITVSSEFATTGTQTHMRVPQSIRATDGDDRLDWADTPSLRIGGRHVRLCVRVFCFACDYIVPTSSLRVSFGGGGGDGGGRGKAVNRQGSADYYPFFPENVGVNSVTLRWCI